ncbi:YceH family protein [Glaciimonas sp. CA11.2]|uniref:YceH family protein n=1 Tax=Glaciimonas sp. CA11.2 TaxID=3048601 RepID=UPI002AB58294|nr:YceH family protein [Glaciimonas sp. CA11.2]MDY7547682.1 YceH family protein [Glaciimonas sp. CA11.2]MEB0161401.1 YceH family protein [Glaciimonas sp. CA11.2]
MTLEAISPSNGDDAILDSFEIRVLAVLAEKEALTPDNYPLSLNTLVNGCNQLSSRDPVMSISESTVLDVLQRLMQRKLVVEVNQAGARVAKYEHRMRLKWTLEPDKLAVLATLMLRGIQTAGEVRMRCSRQYEFASVNDVEIALQFLIDKYPPLVARLVKGPGTKESRYAQLLTGEEILAQQVVAETFSNSAAIHRSDRQDRIAALEEEVVMLRQQVDALSNQFAEFKRQFE